jgi:FHA domain
MRRELPITNYQLMSIYNCPKGHSSTESDYCSECGAKIQGAPQLSIVPKASIPTTKSITCPDCTAPHEPDSGDFCEICGYNFVTGGHGELPVIPATPAVASPQAQEETTTKQASVALAVIVTIDPSLWEEGSPPAPINQAPLTFQLDQPSTLIGRKSDRRGIYPEIALDFDDAISHRHALLNRQPDGSFVLRDIGSSNGTKLNDVEITAMTDVVIKAGDQVTLGHWTRLSINVAN